MRSVNGGWQTTRLRRNSFVNESELSSISLFLENSFQIILLCLIMFEILGIVIAVALLSVPVIALICAMESCSKSENVQQVDEAAQQMNKKRNDDGVVLDTVVDVAETIADVCSDRVSVASNNGDCCIDYGDDASCDCFGCDSD